VPQTVYVVWHGETAWTITGQHTGRTDIPLTSQGEEDARQLGKWLPSQRPLCVLTSPLARARQTCELAGFGADAQPDADLMEWDYGAYEGRRSAEIRERRPHWQLFDDGCPGGETAEMVGARADRVITKVRAYAGDAVLFAHRYLLRVLAVRWIALAARQGRHFDLSPASIGILGYDILNSPLIRVWNDLPRP